MTVRTYPCCPCCEGACDPPDQHEEPCIDGCNDPSETESRDGD